MGGVSQGWYLDEVAVEQGRAQLAHIAGIALAQLLPCMHRDHSVTPADGFHQIYEWSARVT